MDAPCFFGRDAVLGDFLVVAAGVTGDKVQVSRVTGFTAAVRLIDPAAASRALAPLEPLQWLLKKAWLVIFLFFIHRSFLRSNLSRSKIIHDTRALARRMAKTVQTQTAADCERRRRVSRSCHGSHRPQLPNASYKNLHRTWR